jgi:hypothetical protein
MPLAMTLESKAEAGGVLPTFDPHKRHCFVVMPSGRSAEDKRWYQGWYHQVVKPAVLEAEYEPVLAVAEDKPNAISDEMRTHLALDPMVIVDLGGRHPEDDPSPNVMYELGIRHALDRPVVMLAWEDQELPFDVGNQRVIKEARDFLAEDTVKKRIVAFIRSAEEGHFYRPMETIRRHVVLDAAVLGLGPESVLAGLVAEIREMRGLLPVGSAATSSSEKQPKNVGLPKWSLPEAGGLMPIVARAGGTQVDLRRIVMAGGKKLLKAILDWDEIQWRQFLSKYNADPEAAIKNARSSAPPSSSTSASARKPVAVVTLDSLESHTKERFIDLIIGSAEAHTGTRPRVLAELIAASGILPNLSNSQIQRLVKELTECGILRWEPRQGIDEVTGATYGGVLIIPYPTTPVGPETAGEPS